MLVIGALALSAWNQSSTLYQACEEIVAELAEADIKRELPCKLKKYDDTRDDKMQVW